MAKRTKQPDKASAQSLRRMEQAAQDSMVRALVQAYERQMRQMNDEIVALLRDMTKGN